MFSLKGTSTVLWCIDDITVAVKYCVDKTPGERRSWDSFVDIDSLSLKVVKYCVDKTPAERCSWESFVDFDSLSLKGFNEDKFERQIGMFWLQFSRNIEENLHKVHALSRGF